MNVTKALEIVKLHEALNTVPIGELFDKFIGEIINELKDKNGSIGLLGDASQRDANAGGIANLQDIREKLNRDFEEAQEILKSDKSKDPDNKEI